MPEETEVKQGKTITTVDEFPPEEMAYAAGYDAFYSGRPRSDSKKFKPGHLEGDWLEGFDSAEKES